MLYKVAAASPGLPSLR